jgi:hypothetical protein
MPLATARFHSKTCSGCPSCREDYAAMLAETPAQTARRLTAESRRRAASAHGTLRSSSRAASADDQQTHLDAAHDALVKVGASCAARTAEGRRNSKADQAALNDAHDHLVAAGATCPADADDAEPKAASAWRDRMGRRLQGYGSLQPDAPPDPYRALDDVSLALTPDLDPNYQPKGRPADGYALVLAARRFQEQEEADTPAREADLPRDAHGVPDPYAAARGRRAR